MCVLVCVRVSVCVCDVCLLYCCILCCLLFLSFLYFCSVFSFSTVILLVVSFLTCKTVSQITYTVLSETLNEWMNTCIYIAPVKQKSSLSLLNQSLELATAETDPHLSVSRLRGEANRLQESDWWALQRAPFSEVRWNHEPRVFMVVALLDIILIHLKVKQCRRIGLA